MNNRFTARYLLRSLPAASMVAVAACSQGESRDFIGPPPDGKKPTISQIAVAPRVGTIAPGDSIRFSASGRDSNDQPVNASVEWTATGGIIDPSGLFHATQPGAFRVVARSVAQPDKADSADVVVNSVDADIASILIAPKSVRVPASSEQSFSATARLANGTAVATNIYWLATGGDIGPDGVYLAGNTVGQYLVIAVAPNGLADTALVQIPIPRVLTSFRISPSATVVDAGHQEQFAVSTSWSDSSTTLVPVDFSATGGTIAPNGVFTAGSTPGSFRVTAQRRGSKTLDSAAVAIQAPVAGSVAVTPRQVTMVPGASQVFAATARLSDGSQSSVPMTWTASGGSITSNGTFVAGSQTGTFRVIGRAASGTAADTATVSIVSPPATLTSLVLNPSSVSVPAGATRQFQVAASWSDGSAAAPHVTWSATGGTVDPQGLYAAGATAGTFRVVVTQVGGTHADTSVVLVGTPVLARLTLSPKSASIMAGATAQFVASGTLSDGTATTPVVTFSTSAGGTIGSDGTFTAGSLPGTYQVVARHLATGLADTALATVTSPPPQLLSVSLNPASVTLTVGDSHQFAVSGTWSNGGAGTPAVTYSGTGGSVTGAGLYTAGATPGTYRLIAIEQGGLADTSAIVVNAAPPVLTGLILSPASATAQVGGSIQFVTDATWTTGGSGVPPVTYSATGGSISTSGLYLAGPTPGSYRVVVQEAGGLAYTALLSVTAAPPVLTGISISPQTVNLGAGQTRQFTVSASWTNGGSGVPAITYSATGGSVSASGLHTAPPTAGTYRVMATEQGGGLADTATVTVKAKAPVLTAVVLTPASATMPQAANLTFTVSGQWTNGGSGAPAVTYSATGGPITAAGVFTAGWTPGTYRVIATQQGGSLADTSAVTIVAPVVTAIRLAPDSVSIVRKTSQQFSVAGTWSDGASRPVAVTYAVNAGTITAAGLYTAGDSLGKVRVIANCTCGKADTSVVVVVAGAQITLTALSMSPATVSLSTGASQQFTISATWSDGSHSLPAVTYTATGGSVSGGFYTAPPTAGIYQVIVNHSGGTLADTSVVTVTQGAPPPPPPPPPGALYANEPAGVTKISQRDFNAKVENGWTDRGDVRFSIVQDPTAPVSASSVGEALFPTTMTGGTGPIQTTTLVNSGGGKRTMYVAFWIKFSSNWYGHPSGVNKIFHIWINGGNKVYLTAQGIGNGQLAAEVHFQGLGLYDNTTLPRSISWNGWPNLNSQSAVVSRGVWHKWELVLVANTPGQYDGEAHWWFDGVKVGQYTAIGYCSATQTGSANTWAIVDWNPTYGGVGFPPPNNQQMWMDRIYISGK